MSTEHHISDTAFLVNESRLRKVEISEDVYAECWIAPESRDRVRRLWEDFSREVYPFDDIELGIRNRYFLTQLRNLVKAEKEVVFINLGAGFTSYPFLLEKSIPCIEVDFHHVMSFKKDRLRELRHHDMLPERNIELISADLCNTEDLQALKNRLITFVSNRTSFCLLEGITYYLPKDKLTSVTNLVREIQVPGSLFAFDYWNSEIIKHPVFLKLQRFFKDRFRFNVSDYNLIDEDFIYSLYGYESIETTSVVEEEKRLNQTNNLHNFAQILPEYYAVLMRN